ncbi:hypothetical protein [Azospirillum endophyticum]
MTTRRGAGKRHELRDGESIAQGGDVVLINRTTVTMKVVQVA